MVSVVLSVGVSQNEQVLIGCVCSNGADFKLDPSLPLPERQGFDQAKY